MIKIKKCLGCGKKKSLENFNLHLKKYSFKHRCSSCRRKMSRRWFKNRDVDEVNAYQRKYYKKRKKKLRLKYSKRAKKRKLKLLKLLGRKCVDCGYNNKLAALDFDHTNISGKTFGIARGLSVRSWKSLLM